MVILKSGVTGRWGVTSGLDVDLAQLAAATEEERGAISLEKLNGGGGGGLLAWPATAASQRSQWKFIFLIGHISFRIRLDSMLKLMRNYINPIGLTVHQV
jgi:hypothetical protein